MGGSIPKTTAPRAINPNRFTTTTPEILDHLDKCQGRYSGDASTNPVDVHGRQIVTCVNRVKASFWNAFAPLPAGRLLAESEGKAAEEAQAIRAVNTVSGPAED